MSFVHLTRERPGATDRARPLARPPVEPQSRRRIKVVWNPTLWRVCVQIWRGWFYCTTSRADTTIAVCGGARGEIITCRPRLSVVVFARDRVPDSRVLISALPSVGRSRCGGAQVPPGTRAAACRVSRAVSRAAWRAPVSRDACAAAAVAPHCNRSPFRPFDDAWRRRAGSLISRDAVTSLRFVYELSLLPRPFRAEK